MLDTKTQVDEYVAWYEVKVKYALFMSVFIWFQAFKETGLYSDGMKAAEKYAMDYRSERAQCSVSSVVGVSGVLCF